MIEERQGEEVLYLTVKEYADWMKVHVQTVYSAIRFKRNKFHVERIGSAIRIVVPRSMGRRALAARSAPSFQGVYFLRCGEFVKVGVATDVRRRYVGIRHAVPHDVIPLGYMPAASDEDAQRLERKWLLLLREWHHRGEWFRATDELVEMVTEAASPWPSPASACVPRETIPA